MARREALSVEESAQSAQSLVDALSVALGRPVLLDDAALVPLAYSRQWDVDAVRSDSILSRGPSSQVRQALLGQGIAEASGVLRTSAMPELGMAERLCIPVRHRGSCLGYIWLLDPEHELTREELSRAQTTAAGLAKLLADPAKSVADESALLEALCSSSGSRHEQAIVEARGKGVLIDEPLVLCLLHALEDLDPAEAARQAARHLSIGHALAGAVAEGGAILATVTDPVLRALPSEETAAWIHTVLGAGVAVGQSASTDAEGLPEAMRQARLAARAAHAKPSHAAFAAWPTMGPDRLITQLPYGAYADIPEQLRGFLTNEPELAQTLAAFLDAGGDVKAAAAALSLHRSGLYYRLRRIEELSGLKLHSGSDRLLAQLALGTERLF